MIQRLPKYETTARKTLKLLHAREKKCQTINQKAMDQPENNINEIN
jgi:hypothetical protein